LLAIVAISLFFAARFWSAQKNPRQKRNLFLSPVVLQNIEIAHDLVTTIDRVSNYTQRIINLKN
jgi:hypothetical protein